MKYFKLILFFSFFVASLQAQIVANWKVVGPVKFPLNQSGQINGIGRVSQVKFHPSNASRVYAVSASGGLWISNDAMVTWTKTGTDNMPQTACASVCIDATNDQIIYLGTGDANYYSAWYGIWKSTDGGASWNPSNTGIGNRVALEILMDPTNHNTLVAATNDGIWKSIDGGASWVVKKTGGDFKCMIFKPVANSATLYAATSSAFFRSVDMGETWAETLLPGAGLLNGGRIGVSKTDPNIVYVTFVGNYQPTTSTTPNTATPVLKSNDGGLTFSIVKPAGGLNLNGYDENSNGQGNYNYGMTVDPLNPNTIYICGHVIWKSTNGGVNWSRLTSWYSVLHTDMHEIKISPYDNTKIINANDGGVWLSTDGTNWAPKSDGLSISECYHGAQSPIRKDMIDIGTQDNGELHYINNVWFTNGGGDFGGKISFDYQLPTTVYHHLKERKGLNGAANSQLGYPFPQGDNNGNDVELAFSPLQSNTAFVGRTDIYRTTNLSTDPPTWTKISSFNTPVKALVVSSADINVVYVVTDNQKIYRTDNALAATPAFTVFNAPAATNAFASITAIKSNPSVVYLSCGSQLFRSADKGATWTNISFNLPNVNIIKIQADDYSHDESVYVGMATGVYYKNNTVTNWVNYSTGLPTIANIHDVMLFNDGTANSVLRVAYYGRGVWESPLYQNSGITVSLSAPLSNTDFIQGNSIQLSATATATNSTISKVEFYANNTLIGTSMASPFGFNWVNPFAGNYSLTAKAYNSFGSSLSSAAVPIKVWDLRLPENPAGAINGVDFSYFEGSWNILPDFKTLSAVSNGAVANLDLTPRKRDTNFAFQFKGYISIATDGIYTFYTSSDDASKLYIGNTLVVNNDGLHGMIEAVGKIGLKAGLHAITIPYMQGTGGMGLEIRYEGLNLIKQLIPNIALYRVPETLCAGAGSIIREYWGNINGTTVSSIPLKTLPDSITTLSVFEEKASSATNFGTRMRGYVCPPFTGNYTFWIASDDESELWLSTNGKSASKVKIGAVTGSVASQAWDVQPNQKSVSVTLTAGESYYIEALHKQGTGGTNLAVGWQLPDGTFERPIPGKRLLPYSYLPPSATISTPADNAVYYTSDTVVVYATASDSQNSVVKVEFFLNNAKLGESSTAPYAFSWNNIPEGSQVLTVIATNMDGTKGSSTPVHVTVLPLRTPENPPNTLPGIQYSYFQGLWSNLPDFTTLTPLKTGVSTNVDLSPRLREDSFAIRFTGFLNVLTDGIYTLYTTSDDGSKIYIGNKLVATNDGIHGALETAGAIGLKSGKHAFTYDYFQAIGGKSIAFSMKGPAQAKQQVPVSALFRLSNLVTGTVSADFDTGILIYPNPIFNKLTIETTSGLPEIEKVSLTSVDGKVVFESNYSNQAVIEINIEHDVAEGIYILAMQHKGAIHHFRIQKINR
jgi:photosystem II stability/assembly factor-like uncharacterized protein